MGDFEDRNNELDSNDRPEDDAMKRATEEEFKLDDLNSRKTRQYIMLNCNPIMTCETTQDAVPCRDHKDVFRII